MVLLGESKGEEVKERPVALDGPRERWSFLPSWFHLSVFNFAPVRKTHAYALFSCCAAVPVSSGFRAVNRQQEAASAWRKGRKGLGKRGGEWGMKRDRWDRRGQRRSRGGNVDTAVIRPSLGAVMQLWARLAPPPATQTPQTNMEWQHGPWSQSAWLTRVKTVVHGSTEFGSGILTSQ